MRSISRVPCVPQPMYATKIFSLGGTNPAPPSTCRGTMVNAVAAAPAWMNLRRERLVGWGGWVLSLVFRGSAAFVFIGCESFGQSGGLKGAPPPMTPQTWRDGGR